MKLYHQEVKQLMTISIDHRCVVLSLLVRPCLIFGRGRDDVVTASNLKFNNGRTINYVTYHVFA